jgi:hypothetical protein
MALIAHGGPRRITAFLHELAYLVRPRTKTVAIQTVVTHDEPPPVPHHYPPKRADVFESAAMRREMYRL